MEYKRQLKTRQVETSFKASHLPFRDICLLLAVVLKEPCILEGSVCAFHSQDQVLYRAPLKIPSGQSQRQQAFS